MRWRRPRSPWGLRGAPRAGGGAGVGVTRSGRNRSGFSHLRFGPRASPAGASGDTVAEGSRAPRLALISHDLTHEPGALTSLALLPRPHPPSVPPPRTRGLEAQTPDAQRPPVGGWKRGRAPRRDSRQGRGGAASDPEARRAGPFAGSGGGSIGLAPPGWVVGSPPIPPLDWGLRSRATLGAVSGRRRGRGP